MKEGALPLPLFRLAPNERKKMSETDHIKTTIQDSDQLNTRGHALRVTLTPKAAILINELKQKHGELMFHQSGGCCDGSAPMCYPLGDFKVGNADIKIGEIEGCPFFISKSQYQAWSHTHLTIDVVKGRGASFSLEAPEGVRFLTISRTFTEEEKIALTLST